MTTSSLAADLTGCRDTQWLDLLAACQGLPEQIAALCRASIVCVLGEPHPAGCPGQDRPEVHRLGVRRAPPRGAQRTAPGAGYGDTRGVVGGRVGAGAGRSSVDSVDGSPLPSGADTALAGHPGSPAWRRGGAVAKRQGKCRGPSRDTHRARRHPRHEAVRSGDAGRSRCAA